MWIGLGVSPEWVQNVFGVASAAQIDIDKVGHSIRPSPGFCVNNIHVLFTVTEPCVCDLMYILIKNIDTLRILVYLLFGHSSDLWVKAMLWKPGEDIAISLF